MLIGKLILRIRNRINRHKKRCNGIVEIYEWKFIVFKHLDSYQKTRKIPSPWGFLIAPNPRDTLSQIDDIYNENHYKCEFETPPRRILDCGGNIGLSALYFAENYQEAVIEVYEADPRLAEAISKNCQTAEFSNRVHVYSKAVSNTTGTLRFNFTGNDSGNISPHGQETACVDIAGLIGDQLDLLKMDIEGAEFDCFDRLAETNKLGVPSRIIAEVHLSNDDADRMGKIVEQLKCFGFQVAIRGEFAEWTGTALKCSPFHIVSNKKMFMHLYAWK
jgi:FkbM family methyltransferase